MAAEYFKKRGHIVSINKTSGSIVVAYDAEEKSKQTFYVSDTLKFKMLPKLSLGEKVEISIDAGNIVRFIKPIDDEGEVVSREEAKRAPSTSDAILWQTCLKVAGQLVERRISSDTEMNLSVTQDVIGLANGIYEASKEKLTTGRLPSWITDE